MSQEPLDEALKQFEADLAGLKPRVDGAEPGWAVLLARVAAMEASRLTGQTGMPAPLGCPCCGARAGRDPRWWPLAFSAMTALAASLAVLLVYRGETRVAQPEKSLQEAPLPSSPHPDMVVVPNTRVPMHRPSDLDGLASEFPAGQVLSIRGARPNTAVAIEVAEGSSRRFLDDPPGGRRRSVHASRRLLNEMSRGEQEGG